MKKCIWCVRTEEKATFNKLAHTIPKSLGGKNICPNVCDECNSFYGNYYEKLPPVEAVIKEAFNISRARLLHADNRIGKNKAMTRYSSIYFDVDFKRQKIKLKSNYIFHHKNFQEKLCRQLKKGLYKIFLEEIERQTGDALNPKYDFIREFSRYNLGDYPIYYFTRAEGMILMSPTWVENPELFLEKTMHYLVDHPQFFEFELLGHVFGIATSRNFVITLEDYAKNSMDAKRKHFRGMKLVREFRDIDLTLSILND